MESIDSSSSLLSSFFDDDDEDEEEKVTAAEKRSLSLAKKPRLFLSLLLLSSCVLRQPSKSWKRQREDIFVQTEANRNNTKRDEVPHPFRESLNSETSSAVFRTSYVFFFCLVIPYISIHS